MQDQGVPKLPPDSEQPSRPASDASDANANRRAHSRHNIEVEIDLTSDHNFFAGITLDLSEGGVFVATHLEKDIGTLIDLTLRLPGVATPVRCVGEVRWLRAYSESSDVPPGLGLRFVLLEPGAREMIQGFLAAREPMFYDD
jgi:uncharacterized protein (TIGR02266 family)